MRKLNRIVSFVLIGGWAIISCSKDESIDNDGPGNDPIGTTLKPGTMDSTFGTNGIVMADIGSVSTYPTDAVQLFDDKILISALSRDNPDVYGHDFSILKVNPNGTLDNTFSTDGKVRTDVSLTFTEDEANCIALQLDGKIILAGRSNDPGIPSNGNRGRALVRYNGDGTIDQLFGNKGTVYIVNPVFDNMYMDSYHIQDINIANDGKIIVSGQCRTEGAGTIPKMYLFVSKFNTNGTLDNSFGVAGTVKILEGTDSRASMYRFADPRSIKIHTILLNDGKIISTSWFLNGIDPRYWDYAIIKLNSDGSSDNSFGNSGKVYVPIDKSNSFRYCQLGIQGDSKIVIANQKVINGKQSFFITRYNSNGTPDNSFGNGSSVLIDIGSTSEDYANTISIQADGKILVSGTSYDQTFQRKNLGVVRLLSNGNLDASFGDNGKFESKFDPYYNLPIASFISSNKKLRIVSVNNINGGFRTSVVSINL